jgi:hypothetical protein
MAVAKLERTGVMLSLSVLVKKPQSIPPSMTMQPTTTMASRVS